MNYWDLEDKWGFVAFPFDSGSPQPSLYGELFSLKDVDFDGVARCTDDWPEHDNCMTIGIDDGRIGSMSTVELLNCIEPVR